MASAYREAGRRKGEFYGTQEDVRAFEPEKQASSMLSQMNIAETQEGIGVIGEGIRTWDLVNEGFKSRKELGRAAHALGAVEQKRSLGDFIFGAEKEFQVGEGDEAQIMSASAVRSQYKTALADPSSDAFKELKSTKDYKAPSMFSEVKKGYGAVSPKIGEGVSAIGEGVSAVGKAIGEEWSTSGEAIQAGWKRTKDIGGALRTAAGEGIKRRQSEMTDERASQASGRKSILKGLKGLTKSSDTGSGGDTGSNVEVYSPSPGIKKVRGGSKKPIQRGTGGTVKGTAKKLKPGQEPFMPEGKTKESTSGHMWKGKFVKGTREDFLARQKTKPAPKAAFPFEEHQKGGKEGDVVSQKSLSAYQQYREGLDLGGGDLGDYLTAYDAWEKKQKTKPRQGVSGVTYSALPGSGVSTNQPQP